jgi:hypothetical protein
MMFTRSFSRLTILTSAMPPQHGRYQNRRSAWQYAARDRQVHRTETKKIASNVIMFTSYARLATDPHVEYVLSCSFYSVLSHLFSSSSSACFFSSSVFFFLSSSFCLLLLSVYRLPSIIIRHLTPLFLFLSRSLLLTFLHVHEPRQGTRPNL